MHPDTAKRILTVRVVKHLPLGLAIKLENGQRGIVRVREISWDASIRNNWRTHFPVGWSGQAVAIDTQDDGEREFSLRLTEYDPWETIAAESSPESIYDGIVTGVVSYGAFIELAEGLTGLLHQERLPAWVGDKKIHDLFWPGDRAQVVIHSIDMERRRIELGLPPVTTELDNETPETPAINRPQRYTTGLADLDEFLRSAKKRLHILLVEDEKEQAWSVETWLRQLEQRVEIVGSADAALKFLQKNQPDLALVDVGLPDMDGVTLAQRILDQYPAVRVVSATDWARADRMTDALNNLREQGVELLMKPLLPEDLLRIIDQEKPQLAELRKLETEVKAPLMLSRAVNQKLSGALKTLLQQARRRLGFELAILFAFDANNRSVSIVEVAGEAYLARHVTPSLVYSPVRDVAEDGDTLFSGEILPAEHNRFKYLYELYPTLSACIGLKVPTQSKLNYALFLLDKHPKAIPEEFKLYTEAIALSIGSVLEHNLFRERSIVIQRTALIGHLTSALVHEINNLISPLYTRIDGIRRNVDFLEKRDDPREVQLSRIRLVNSELGDAQVNIKRMVDTARMFRNIIRKSDEGIIRVDDIIKETLGLLSDTSDDAKVRLYFTPPQSLAVVRGYAGTFEQVLLNVILNAVQQVGALRPNLGGWVHIWIDLNPADAAEGCFQILIEDNGPGIHTSLWETVFEPGYTTREDGSGIGLYISKSMVDELGGRLFVRESRILGGTTFALEIPRHI